MTFLGTQLDNFLHKNSETAEAIRRKILQAEKERKELSGIQKAGQRTGQKGQPSQQKAQGLQGAPG